jgi:hypothetical protein
VSPRECCEFELDVGTDPNRARAKCGLACDRIEYNEPCSGTVRSHGYTIVEGYEDK